MKWLRPYATLMLVVSIIMIVTSFYMMEFMPILYKLYTGIEISPEKMDKLTLVGNVFIHEVRVISIFSSITFTVLLFVKNIKQYLLLVAIGLLVHFLFIAEITEYAIFKRVYKLFLMLPLLWIFFDYFKFKKENYEKRVTHGFLYLTLVFLIVPGLYAPPFFSGIQGWTIEIDKKEPILIEGVFLVRQDGKEIRYTRGITNPINFLQRIDNFFINKHPDKLEELLTFYENIYIKQYSTLKEGKIPSQVIMGNFSYPTHNPVGAFDYSSFPPSSIKSIKIIRKRYRWNRELIDEEILASKEW